MNGYERTCKFVMGELVDHPPFMPLVIEWVSRQCGLEYPDFVYHPDVRAKAYLEIVEKFDMDHVLPDADFSEQLEDFGQVPKWTEAGFQVEPIINSEEDLDKLTLTAWRSSARLQPRKRATVTSSAFASAPSPNTATPAASRRPCTT